MITWCLSGVDLFLFCIRGVDLFLFRIFDTGSEAQRVQIETECTRFGGCARRYFISAIIDGAVSFSRKKKFLPEIFEYRLLLQCVIGV